MPYDAFVVDGSQVKVTISSTPTLIPGVRTAGFSGSTKPTIEYTAISDTAAKFKTGRPDFGSFNFTIAYDPADTTHQYLLTRYATAGTTDAWTITLSDAGAAAVTFNGSMQTFDLQLEGQQVGLVSCTVKLDGAITVTP